MFVRRAGPALVRPMECNCLRRLCWRVRRGVEYLANTRSNRCSELRSLATELLRSPWFGTRIKIGNRT
jgi:hypothetical protein